jgi:hypothetical protein
MSMDDTQDAILDYLISFLVDSDYMVINKKDNSFIVSDWVINSERKLVIDNLYNVTITPVDIDFIVKGNENG